MPQTEQDVFPPQVQDRQPGLQTEMRPKPKSEDSDYRPAGKLQDKVALITGADSGIGRAVAIAYAKEGADVVNVYLEEHEDAEETRARVEKHGRRCLNLAGDIGGESFCREAIERAVREFGKLDILVNNAAEQHVEEIDALDTDQMERVFRTNIFSMFYLCKYAMPHLQPGSAIINTTSVTAYKGQMQLLSYSTTKGAIVTFTYSLSQVLAEKNIRVNAVAPGPVWTPLIPASFPEEKVKSFGKDVPLGRPADPTEIAPAYVFLASEDSSYMTGQVLHPNGGTIVQG